MIVAALFTGYNMMNFPHFESDEGTYVSSAWAMLKEGKLAYYTYHYDHPPLAWALVALWSEITGGFATFGTSVATGRSFMLIVTLASTAVVFLTTRMIVRSASIAVFAAVAFAVSPLGVALHRQVWLDNVATLFLLLTLYGLLAPRLTLTRVLLSGFAFGLAFWSKETFVIFLPALTWIAYSLSPTSSRRFATAIWVAATSAGISLFALLALLQDELLPPGTLWSSTQPHVSLILTFVEQVSRSGGYGFVDRAIAWLTTDPLLFAGGITAAGLGLSIYRNSKPLQGISLAAACYVAFVGRGGPVLDYYAIPLAGLLALALGIALARALSRLSAPARSFTPLILVALVLSAALPANAVNFTADRTSAQREALDWILQNAARDDVLLVDSYGWVDLRDTAGTRTSFTNAHFYWPAQLDPSVRDVLLKGDWRNVDYLVHSPSVASDVARGQLPLISEAIANTDTVRTFQAYDWTMAVYRIRKLREVLATEDRILARAWQSYKGEFIEAGRVIDPRAGRVTTSEAQAYALLRAVYMDDKAEFDEVWTWTRRNLQIRGDALFAWKWGTGPDGGERVLDMNSATDGDEDIALALLFASRHWGERAYEREALAIVDSIWDLETVKIGEHRVLVAGTWARGDWSPEIDQPVMNPSYLAPNAYRVFAAADATHPWMELVDSSYELLTRIRNSPDLGGAAGLIPNWVEVDRDTGLISIAESVNPSASLFSYDASRLFWRLTLDALWWPDPRAGQALKALTFVRDELRREGRLMASYDVRGRPAVDYESSSIYAATLGGLLFDDDPTLVHRIYATRILSTYRDGHWGEPDDYFYQNWAWFATALMDGALGNLWLNEKTTPWNAIGR